MPSRCGQAGVQALGVRCAPLAGWHASAACGSKLPKHNALQRKIRASCHCSPPVLAINPPQMNYLNKALDLFNTAVVTPIYYVMFTTATIAASMIMMREQQTLAQVRLARGLVAGMGPDAQAADTGAGAASRGF